MSLKTNDLWKRNYSYSTFFAKIGIGLKAMLELFISPYLPWQHLQTAPLFTKPSYSKFVEKAFLD